MTKPQIGASRPSILAAPTVADLIPPDPKGLFHAYVARAQRITDAPDLYHVGALLGGLSAVIAPHCVFSFGKGVGDHPLHLWVMLSGASGNRKTYCVDLATQVGDKKKKPDGIFAPWLKKRMFDATGSLRGLEDLVAQEPNTFFRIREGGAFLAENRGRPGGVSPSWWCKMFDGQLQDRAVRTSGIASFDAGKARNRYILPTLLAATATDAMRSYTKPVDWSGGFLARMLFVDAGRGQRRIEHGWWSDADIARIRELVTRAEEAARRSGSVTWDKDARWVYEPWFNTLPDAVEGLGPGRSAILDRLDRHVRVIAGLYALGSGVSVITGPIMRAAVALGRLCHGAILRLPTD